MTDANKVTISRETLQSALDAVDPHFRWHTAIVNLRAALAAQPVEPSRDTTLRNAARRSATIVDRGRLVQPVEPVAWRDHVEQRIRTWRQRNMNKSGDRLAIDDFMGQESIDDLVDFVCDEYAAPPAPAAVPLTEEVLNIHKPYYSNIEWPCFKAGVRFAEMVHAIAAAGDKP